VKRRVEKKMKRKKFQTSISNPMNIYCDLNLFFFEYSASVQTFLHIRRGWHSTVLHDELSSDDTTMIITGHNKKVNDCDPKYCCCVD
jgi:hypothetical protein